MQIRIHLGPWIQWYKMKGVKTNKNLLKSDTRNMLKEDIIADILLMRANIEGLG